MQLPSSSTAPTTTSPSLPTKTPIITISTLQPIAPISRKIYSGFAEHMGRCIYGGILPSTYPSPSGIDDCTTDNFRKDVLHEIREINPPLVRYPGGNFVANYNWRDGVGPLAERKPMIELAWLNVEPNTFGTNEFMKWCKAAGTAPMLCLNMGTGDLREALAWIEYCNISKASYYANLRQQHGVENAYGVEYVCLGNEVWGPWQVAQTTKEEYAAKAVQWAKAIRLLDPKVKLILCGSSGLTDWDRYVIGECVEWVDHVSLHYYSRGTTHEQNVFSPMVAERSILVTKALIELARVHKPLTGRQVKICFDEWNVWDPIIAPGDKGAEQSYTVSDMLAVASFLAIFVRHADVVDIACIAQSVNVISPLMTRDGEILKQTTWWPYLLFAKYMRGTAVHTHTVCDEWSGELVAYADEVPKVFPVDMIDTRFLDVAAAVDEEGYLVLAVVNKYVCDVEVEVRLDCGRPKGVVMRYEVSGGAEDMNTWEDKEKVVVHESEAEWTDKVKLKATSVTMFRCRI